MTTIADCLPGLATQSWSLVLHIGAGATGALESHAKLSPRRLVLVEGDAEMARELTLAARALPAAEVLSHAVSPAGGELSWHRYNLRALNGPLPASGLEVYYPRLRPVSTETVRSVAIADLVDQLLPDGATGNLLVLDVPGQELALLQALGVERLTRFDKVLVHGRNLDTGHGQTLPASLAWLQAHHVVLASSSSDAPKRLWDTVAGSVDRRAVEVSRLEMQLQAAGRQREELSAQLRAAQEADAAARDEAANALARMLDEHRAAETALSGTLEQLRAELASERQERARLSASLDETTRQRDEQKHWHEENAKWARALDGQLKAVQADLAEREQGLARVEAELAQRTQALQAAEEAARAAQAASEAELTRLAQQAEADRQAAADALDALRSDVARLQRHGEELEARLKAAQEADAAARAELESERQERTRLSASLDETTRQRDEQKHWHEENAKWAKALDAQLKAVQADLAEREQGLARVEAELAQRTQALQAAEEAARAAQAASEAELTRLAQQAEADRQAAADALDALRSDVARLQRHGEELEAQLKAAQEADAAARAELESERQERARLSALLDETSRQRDEHKHWHEENAKWAKALEAQLQATKEELEGRARAAQDAEAALAPVREQVTRLTQERDTEAHWHHENAKWAQALKAELDPLKAEHERLQRELALAQRELAEARGRADSVQREMEDRDARQRLMDTEILRAEAQLDLIKEVLIREKNF